MFDIFGLIRSSLEEDRSIPTPTLLNLNPSSQVCIDLNTNEHIGTCPRRIWFQKNDFKKTNNIPVTNIANLAGNWYEDWFISALKETGIYYSSSFSATDVKHLVKGIVDVCFKNPKTSELELGEVKSYDGSNYFNATKILGNKTTPPKPKDSHLLQAFRYSLIFKDKIKINNLFYIDRACSQWYKNKQFQIELVEINNNFYPKISTIWNNEYYEYVDTRISSEGIYQAERNLLENFSEQTPPSKPFIEVYDEDMINIKKEEKAIPEYLLEKNRKDPINNTLGDSACSFCPYAKGLCNTYDESL